MSTTDHVLVTGGFGLVGTATVEKLVADGRRVTVTDLDTPANREAAAILTGADVRWCDLTDPKALEALLVAVVPTAVIHLAAVIPPFCYSRPALARKVNVGATQSLTTAAAQLANPPRLVVASSIATYGPRNPYRVNDILTVKRHSSLRTITAHTKSKPNASCAIAAWNGSSCGSVGCSPPARA